MPLRDVVGEVLAVVGEQVVVVAPEQVRDQVPVHEVGALLHDDLALLVVGETVQRDDLGLAAAAAVGGATIPHAPADPVQHLAGAVEHRPVVVVDAVVIVHAAAAVHLDHVARREVVLDDCDQVGYTARYFN